MPTHLIGRRCLNEIFCVLFSPICRICVRRGKRLQCASGDCYRTSDRGKGDVSDRGYHSNLAHLLDVSRRLKVFPSSSAPGSGFRLRTTFVGFASQEQCLTIFLRNRFSD